MALARSPCPAGIGAVADLREQLRARGGQRPDELIDPRCRNAYVEVLTQRAFHQLIQYRVAELLPPLRVRNLGGLGVVDAPSLRLVHAGTHGVRSDRAADEASGNNQQRYEHVDPHLDLLLVMHGSGKRRLRFYRCAGRVA